MGVSDTDDEYAINQSWHLASVNDGIFERGKQVHSVIGVWTWRIHVHGIIQ